MKIPLKNFILLISTGTPVIIERNDYMEREWYRGSIAGLYHQDYYNECENLIVSYVYPINIPITQDGKTINYLGLKLLCNNI